MKITKIDNLDFETLYKILSSNKITETQKSQFIIKNRPEIAKLVEIKISGMDYQSIMQKRSLQKFRPLKNSFTKRGDKIILAKALNINPSEVPNFIKKATDSIQLGNLDFLSPERVDMIKTYVYRHGSKDELVTFLDYELTKSKDKIKTLYRTLEYHSGGVADYFIRPIHRMDNKTLIKVYNVIDKHVKASKSIGLINDAESKKIALWALKQIYIIQNNSKLINAIKTYKTLS